MIKRHIIEPVTAPGAAATTARIERSTQESDHLIAGKSLAYTETIITNPNSYPVLSRPLDRGFSYVTFGNILKI